MSSFSMENAPFNCGYIDTDSDGNEDISDSFICCVCLDLLYKPIVIDCGHVSCFWCVHKSMDSTGESLCPICRNPYRHFPTICAMLHFLLLKMYPLAYRKREKQVLEEEKQMDCFSPHLDSNGVNSVGASKTSLDSLTPSGTNSIACEGRVFFREHGDGLGTATENNSSAMDINQTCSISRNDVLCQACKQVLFCPAVLNCGHVYCEACIIVPDDGIIICKVCECPHPTDFPNVCLELSHFLEEKFPEEYAERKQNEHKQKQFQHKDSPDCSKSKKSAKKGFSKSPQSNEDSVAWLSQSMPNIHRGVGCDNCGVYPIIGDRYKCIDCEEKIGFDLCGSCYNTRSKRPGRFNQQHTPDHRLELVKLKRLTLPDNLMLRFGGDITDNPVGPVLAISAIEDSPDDGWIAIESAIADVAALDGFDEDNNTTQDHPTSELSDAQEINGNDATSTHQYEQDGNG